MKLNDWMASSGVSVADLADKLGVSRYSIYRYRGMEQVPARMVMRKIVEVTNGAVRPEDFYPELG